MDSQALHHFPELYIDSGAVSRDSSRDQARRAGGMAESSGRHSSEFDPDMHDPEEQQSSMMSPRSRSRRTARRTALVSPAGLSDDDYDEDELDEPVSPRKSGGKKGARGGRGRGSMTPRDDSGRPLSPAEARRMRKRVTNRESARRMRLLRKEEWNNLQQEVSDKTSEVQRLSGQIRRDREQWEQDQQALRAAMLQLSMYDQRMRPLIDSATALLRCLHDGFQSKNMDSERLLGAIRNLQPLLEPFYRSAPPLTMSHPVAKPEREEGKPFRIPDNRIHIVANGTSAGYHAMHMTRSASAPEPPHNAALDSQDACPSPSKRLRTSAEPGGLSPNIGGLSPSVGGMSPSTPMSRSSHPSMIPLHPSSAPPTHAGPAHQKPNPNPTARALLPAFSAGLPPKPSATGMMPRSASMNDCEQPPRQAGNPLSSAVDALLSDAMPSKPAGSQPTENVGGTVHTQLSLGPGIDGMMDLCHLDGALGSGDFAFPTGISRGSSMDSVIKHQTSFDNFMTQMLVPGGILAGDD